MCFYQGDYDWLASVSSEKSEPAPKKIWCNECHRTIEAGQITHHIYQQEHEECRRCSEGECECVGSRNDEDDPQDHDCKCAEPNFGETFDYDRCDDCHKFLCAIEAAEIDAGCKPYEARPSLCGMIENITNADNSMDEAKRYFKKARSMFPELVASKYLAWLWRKMFRVG